MNRTMQKPEVSVATLSLGGNTGDVAAAFGAALRALGANEQVCVIARSSVWRTPPWGKTDQPDFLNMAVCIETSLSPRALLELCLATERAAGRERGERWGPRPLDIDIITYGDLVIDEPELTIPHPRAHERAFVLVPLAEIAGDMKLGHSTIAEWAARSDCDGMSRDSGATTLITNNF
jgi:2-amino-4-hydroxy-6-hydroxymethyldihydropteridine diphosphokinase